MNQGIIFLNISKPLNLENIKKNIRLAGLLEVIQNLSLRPLKKKLRFEFKTSSLNARLFVPAKHQTVLFKLSLWTRLLNSQIRRKLLNKTLIFLYPLLCFYFFAVQKVSNNSLCIHPKYFRTDSGYSSVRSVCTARVVSYDPNNRK